MKNIEDNFTGVRIEPAIRKIFDFSSQDKNSGYRVLGANIYSTNNSSLFDVIGHHVGEAEKTVTLIKQVRKLLKFGYHYSELQTIDSYDMPLLVKAVNNTADMLLKNKIINGDDRYTKDYFINLTINIYSIDELVKMGH